MTLVSKYVYDHFTYVTDRRKKCKISVFICGLFDGAVSKNT
jgi:hypothetical protein